MKEPVCGICQEENQNSLACYHLGIAHYRDKEGVEAEFSGQSYMCSEHVGLGLELLGHQAFGSEYWPVIATLNKALIYHGCLANESGVSVSLGWSTFKRAYHFV